jgi:hypothetical protein
MLQDHFTSCVWAPFWSRPTTAETGGRQVFTRVQNKLTDADVLKTRNLTFTAEFDPAQLGLRDLPKGVPGRHQTRLGVSLILRLICRAHCMVA